MKTRTIESTAVQLFAVRETIRRFERTEKALAAVLRNELKVNEPVITAGLKVCAELVPAHSVPRYDVPEYTRISITEAGRDKIMEGQNHA